MAIETAKLNLLFLYIFKAPKNEFLFLLTFERFEVSELVTQRTDSPPVGGEIQIKKPNPFIILTY